MKGRSCWTLRRSPAWRALRAARTWSFSVRSRWACRSDSTEYGTLRLIVNKPVEAAHLLRDAGFSVRDAGVIIVDLPDQPGGLASILKIVSEAGVNIEYVYSLIGTYVVLNVANTRRAVSLLQDTPVRMVSQEEISAT